VSKWELERGKRKKRVAATVPKDTIGMTRPINEDEELIQLPIFCAIKLCYQDLLVAGASFAGWLILEALRLNSNGAFCRPLGDLLRHSLLIYLPQPNQDEKAREGER
jgi:hypothetical protein